MTSEHVKIARHPGDYNVTFHELREGNIVYQDSIFANSVEEAINKRFLGPLPEGFVVGKVTPIMRR